MAPCHEHAIFLQESFFDLALSVMDGKTEKRVCIKFCMKLGKSAIETLEMLLQVFG
jgi:hypothetical protein